MRCSRVVVLLSLLSMVTGCMFTSVPRGMAEAAPRRHAIDPAFDEVARAQPSPGERALLVVFPRDACSGSAKTVFLDGRGRFFGAVGPGEAALLTIPARTKSLLAISNVEIAAPVGMSTVVDETPVPPAPSGLLLHSWRRSTHQCANKGFYAHIDLATAAELEQAIGESDLVWLEPRPADGRAWIAEHKDRVAELLAR